MQTLDELGASGLCTQAFAQAKGLSYTQLRVWQNHEMRWRERLAPVESVKLAPPIVRSGFLQVQPRAHQPLSDTNAPGRCR